MELSFYNGKRVFVTGHTGFKGSWLCRLLTLLGAEVTGYALQPPTNPSFFKLAAIERDINSVTGDIRDLENLTRALCDSRAEIVFHMAAQPIVTFGFSDPVNTYETNVMGTVNICEAVRKYGGVRSFAVITTDKVYADDNGEPRREEDRLCGADPYSNSKSCCELVTACYRQSYFGENTAVSTCRAGNVIGGGDFAPHRIIPDCVRAIEQHRPVELRAPHSVRPYQYVLDCLAAYLHIAAAQFERFELAGSYNIGPMHSDYITTGELAELFCKSLGGSVRQGAESAVNETAALLLDSGKLLRDIGFLPRYSVREAIEKTAEWSREYLRGGDIRAITTKQAEEYLLLS